MKVMVVASLKGGVGKTTTALNLAHARSLSGRSTLLIDLDPQANATSGLGVEPVPVPILERLREDPTSWRSCISATPFADLSIVPSAVNVDAAPSAAALDPVRVDRARAALEGLEERFDTVVVDCPPAAGPIPLFALQLADTVLVPVQCEYYAMEGLSQMLPLVEGVRQGRARPLELAGIVLTMFDPRFELSREVESEVRRVFPDLTCRTVIPRDVAIAESSSHGQPVAEYDVRSVGTWAYVRLAKELFSW